MKARINFERESCKEGLLSVRFPLKQRVKQQLKVHTIVVADSSGSMSGRPWVQVQDSLRYICKEAFAKQLPLDVLTYSYRAAKLDLWPSSYEQTIARTTAANTTNFGAVFKLIQSQASAVRGVDEICVVFMTDGNDTCQTNLDKTLKEFTTFAKKSRIPIVVHSVGFSSSHNFNFLQQLRACGTREGVYRYAEPSDGADALNEKMQDMFLAFSEQSTDVPVMVTPLGFKFQGATPTTALVTADRHAEVHAWVTLDTPLAVPVPAAGGAGRGEKEKEVVSEPFTLRDVSLLVDLPDTQTSLACEVTGKIATRNEALQMQASRFRHMALELTQRTATAIEKGRAFLFSSGLLQDITDLQQQVKSIPVFNKRMDKDTRIELLETRSEVQEIIDDMHRAVATCAHAAAGDSESVLARASDIRFAGTFSKARRQRRVDQRAASNIARQTQIDEQLKALPRCGDLGLSAEARDFFFCSLAQTDIQDLMLEDEGDVMGFGLAVQRPEAVVDAPTLIDVFGISGTLLSRTTMEDAVRYKFALDEHIKLAFTEAPEIVSGRSREPINAWMPLYIHAAHWQRVRLLMEPILGYFVCLDHLAFHKDQFNCFFAIIGRMLAHLSVRQFGEREAKLFFAFVRTARAVATDFNLLEDIRAKVRAFAADPGQRTKDVMSNLLTLLGYVCVLDPADLDQLDWTQFTRALAAETVRRAAGVVYHARSDGALLEVINRLVNGRTGASQDPVNPDQAVQFLLRDAPAPAVSGAGAGAAAAVEPVVFDARASLGAAATSALDKARDDAHQQEVNPKFLKALAVHGQAQGGAVPGPHVQKKIEAAQKIAELWWKSLAAQDEATAAAGRGFRPERLTGSMLETMHEVELELSAHMRPTLTTLLMFNDFVRFWQRLGQGCDRWATLDANGGLAPAAWLEELKEMHMPAPQSIFAALRDLLPEADSDQLVQYLRATVVQACTYHRNRDARTAAARKEYIDLVDAASAAKVLQTHFDLIAERQDKAMADINHFVQWQQANRQMLRVKDLWAFVGMLSRTHPDRNDGYNDLLNLMLTRGHGLPLLPEKLKIMITGEYDGRKVFARGNALMPVNKDTRSALRAAMGAQEFDALDVKLLSQVAAHVYRPSDIPNRHGSCNSNPHRHYECALCQANGFSRRKH
eukprot:m.243708 g.243708  ORF g.243708 m.243708 type:complete len:1154 (+) comp22552_c0_seq3:1803-5264(+)